MADVQSTIKEQAVDDEARSIGRISYDTTGQLLSPIEQSRYTSGWTPLAKKYSRPLGKFASVDHRILGDGGKSGLTPREHTTTLGKNKRKNRSEKTPVDLEIYQRKRFNGFTNLDLDSIQALAALDTNVIHQNLENPIHPCFALERWVVESQMPKHKGAIPILGREEGFWIANNPVVWRMLKPCLRLATLMLHHECKYSWLDALLNGRSEAVPNSPKGLKLQRFFSRRHGERINHCSPEIIERTIQDLTSRVVLGFHSGYEDVATGLPRSRTSRNAITRNHTVYDRIEVLISIELAQPLLRIDLTDAEKMGNRLRVATTLVHEFAIWGGQPTSLITQVYNRGGPGLPNLGIVKTSWFTDKNKSYQTSRKAPPLNRKPRRGRIDTFHTYDYWPVPTSWYGTLFTEEFWGNVRKFGPEAKKMKIETFGMRFLSDDHPDARTRIDDGRMNIGGGWPYEAPQTRGKTKRFRIKSKIASTLTQQANDDDIRENHDPLDYLNARPPIVTYSCPRWDDITGYLFDHRGPLELALDSMGVLSEPAFFRYIRDHGGITLTPMEFRGFLGVANEREELFLWEPFPGFGIVKRIATGWPPPTPGPNSISLPTPIGEPDQEDMETLDNLMSDQEVQEALYEYCGEGRDLDIETFRRWLVYRFDAEEFNGENATEEFRDIIWETVREGGAYFTLGPKDIVRFIYPVEDIREEKADEFTKERMKTLKKKADGADSGILST
ncbi:hypothetical protein MFRU_031g00570 [Monilinia fructicola]|nr:hypothetical protein MFRU_031g00570 [Monilinia fructicola]